MTLGSWERAFQNRSSSSFFEHLRQTAPHLLPGGEAIPGEPANPSAMPPVPHGTTVLALRYRDGVVIAGDRQASEGYQVAHRRIEKIFKADDLSAVGIAGADGLVDTSMEFGGFLEITIRSLFGGFAAPLVIECGNHFNESADDGISGCGRDRTVKRDVVD